MVRLELLIFIGFIIGFPLGYLVNTLLRKWREKLVKRIEARKVRVDLQKVSTDELLDEVSKRDDLTETKKENVL